MTTTDMGRRGRLAVVDIIAFIVLAACIGLGTGIVLGGAVILLSGNAAAAELEAMKPGQAQQGILLLKSAHGTSAVPALDTEVHFRVSGIVARAQVRQTFRNPSADWQEGIYVFPLPENAAVDHMKMRIGERVVEGDIKEKAAARAAFEQAKQSGQRAALVEQERPNIFTTSVANIAPNGDIVVEIEYQQTLRYENAGGGGRFSLRFPMVVGPRYIPGSPDGTHGNGGTGWAPNTDQVPDAARITPPVPKPRDGQAPLNPVRIRVELDAGVPLASVDSPYHRITVSRPDERRAGIELTDGSTPANRDFELTWTLAPAHAPQAALFVEKAAGRNYGLLLLVPPAAVGREERLPRESIFVIDTSGSMEGQSIRQAKEALEMAVARLTPRDRFNVIEFNSTATALFRDAQAASPDNVSRAVGFVRGLRAQGGTEMAAALNLALNGREDPQRVRQVIFLTDGAVGNEDALFRLIQQKLGDSRLFTVGIGSAPNSWFMSKAAQSGRGSFTYIGRIEEVKKKMAALFAKLESPVLKGVRIDWPAGAQVEAWPQRLPDLYLGEPLVVSFAFDQAGGDIRIGGVRGDAPWSAALPFAAASAGEGLGVIWAREKIQALTDNLRDGAGEEQVKPQVVEIALAHHLVSKYTSLVAVDKTPARPADAALQGGAMPTNLPEGWNHEAVFGELPRGATDAQWHLLLGAVALALSALLLLGARRQQTFACRAVAALY